MDRWSRKCGRLRTLRPCDPVHCGDRATPTVPVPGDESGYPKETSQSIELC